MNDRDVVEQMLQSYSAAVYAKDVDAFTALYDDDITVFDMWGRWAYRGIEAWRSMAAEWFGSLGDERSSPEFSDIEVDVADTVAAAHAFLTFRGLSADGKELRRMDNRLTWVLRKNRDGAWKVVHEHSSAPVDVESGKVNLRR